MQTEMTSWPTEVDEAFGDLESFTAWCRRSTWLHPTMFEKFAQRICAQGFVEPLSGRIAAAGTVQPVGSFREGLGLDGICSRVRAVMRVIEKEIVGKKRGEVRIYAAEATTPFAMRMRGLFPNFIGSEYTQDAKLAAEMFPIPREDLTRLSFPDNVFDIVCTNDVLEHVPDMNKALRQIARVLRPGGAHVGTTPFIFNAQKSVRKASLVRGRIKHLAEPEYHRDPFGHKGALVFEVPGWEILGRCLDAGFSYAAMQFVMSERFGCLTNGSGGVFVLLCRK
jgi:SAM-dependent methyltransferase